ncbi:MAG TPA: hypothetical protein VHE60_15385 [Pyrinomonadaceae bacterium]|nr:hypothetical protein [Pyrinomonadaceae bacterium]
MPGWLKALLIVAVVIVLLVLGCIGAGVYWWTKNKDALIARGKAVVTEGRDFGRNSDNQGCVDESMSRYKKEPGFTSAISNSLFMRSCLDSSRPTPNFCSDVPKATEFVKSAQWRVEQCRRIDLSSDSYCQQLFQPVQEFCERRTRRSDENSNTNSY